MQPDLNICHAKLACSGQHPTGWASRKRRKREQVSFLSCGHGRSIFAKSIKVRWFWNFFDAEFVGDSISIF
jgi:hypothetical protein